MFLQHALDLWNARNKSFELNAIEQGRRDLNAWGETTPKIQHGKTSIMDHKDHLCVCYSK